MCSAHFDCFYMCYSRLAVILDSKASKKYAKVGIICMYPDSRLNRPNLLWPSLSAYLNTSSFKRVFSYCSPEVRPLYYTILQENWKYPSQAGTRLLAVLRETAKPAQTYSFNPHNRTVPSRLPVASQRPSGLKATVKESVCPSSWCSCWPLWTSQKSMALRLL
jgi:hypothetical protein